MPKRPFPENAREELRVALKRARTKGQYERVLCLWMRAALNMPADQVAIVLDWNVWAVRRLQAQYLNQGAAVLAGPGRGGRRRSLLKWREEVALLDRMRHEAWPDSLVDFAAIHSAVEQAVGRRVPSATVHRMLDRHSWRVHALVVPMGGTEPLPEEERAGSYMRAGILYFPPEAPPDGKQAVAARKRVN
jgi:hypothetical protein